MKTWILVTVAAPLLGWVGAGCSSPRTEVTACSIDGELVPDGTRNAQNQCQVCRAKNSASTWSNIAAGTSCGDGTGSFCAGGSCQAGCYIDSIFFASAAPDPSNSCLACEPSIDANNWSPITGVPPVGACPLNGVCFQGHCQPGCTIGTTQVPAGTPNPDNFCQSCQPGQGTSTWTDKAPGATCADGGAVCAKGNCTAGCEIDGVFYSPGGASPDNVCQTCQPKESLTSFSPATGLAPGGTCGNGSYCYKGECSGGCAIGGTSYAPGDTDPTNACLGCDPTVSAITWSSVEPGTPCAGSGVCSGGTCLFGCQIGGLLFPPGTNDPAQVCQSCQPAVSPTAWSPLTGIPTDGCTGGEVCLDGGCVAGCFIKKAYYQVAERKPGDNGQCCSPGTDPALWSPTFSAGTSLIPISSGNYSYYYQSYFQVLTADFNRDNLADVAIFTSYPSALAVFINQGDGGFSQGYAGPSLGLATGAAGDLNGDGYPDLAIGSGSTVYVLTNQGDGGFGPQASYASNAIYYDAGPTDGGVPVYYQGSYYYYYYYGSGPTVALSDVNHDGFLDVVSIGGALSGSASVLLGKGNGGVQAAVAFNTGFVSTYALASADFNGDGWPDLIVLGDTSLNVYDYSAQYGYIQVSSSNPGVSVYLNDGTGAYGQPSALTGLSATPAAFALGDFDGDGKTDIALTTYSNDQLLIFNGTGNGTFKKPVAYALTEYYYYAYGLTVGDFNGDGFLDLLANGYPTLFLNKGDGTFLPGANIYPPSYLYASAAARFHESGPDDLATVDSYLTFTPYFNNCR